MGKYLNPGKAMFEKAVNAEIYVDKTGLIAETNAILFTEQQYACVSRPRQFGKSMTINMLAAYYDCTVDSHTLFRPFAIASHPSYEEAINTYNVIRIDMAESLSTGTDIKAFIAKLECNMDNELHRAFPEAVLYETDTFPQRLSNYYLSMPPESQRRFVILIDDWDSVLREYSKDENSQRVYLNWLRDWLKDQDYIELVYMTGILPVKKYGDQSALNMFSEYSMTQQRELAQYTGFTKEEVEELCMRYNRNPEEMAQWYNGYRAQKPNGGELEIYAPHSVIESIRSGRYGSHWDPSSWGFVRDCLSKGFEGLEDAVNALVAGGRVPINVNSFINDWANLVFTDDVLTLLVHCGYLAYDRRTGEVYIPNNEAFEQFLAALAPGG